MPMERIAMRRVREMLRLSRDAPGRPARWRGGPGGALDAVRRELCGLRRTQGLAPDAVRGLHRRTLHRGAVDARDGPAGRDPRQAGAHDAQRSGRTLPVGPRQSPAPCAGARQPLAIGLQIRSHLGGVSLRRVRDRRPRPSDRRLARQPHRARPATKAATSSNAFCRLKDYRRVATRYDKLAPNFLASVGVAIIVAFWRNESGA